MVLEGWWGLERWAVGSRGVGDPGGVGGESRGLVLKGAKGSGNSSRWLRCSGGVGGSRGVWGVLEGFGGVLEQFGGVLEGLF